ncbi:MAG TPA: GTPase HflX [Thermaerobacter sp.]
MTTVRRHDLPERALLVGVEFDRKGELTLTERMTELRELAVSAGAEVVGEIRQRRGRPEPATLIGPGKVEEVAAARQQLAADVVIFDHDLTPAQQRNLERAIGGKVIDRTQLILDIFAARARTREGQLQVELAQLQYLLPRLAGMGEALSRLGGGIGTRGPGETRLEVDRRRIRRRITELRRLLAEVRRHRAIQRKRRERTGVPVVALVGYTNAGKTTLLRALVAAYGDPRHLPPAGRDRLFDTLDPTVRRVEWPGVGPVLVTDTVGFIHDLPPHLIAAFRATLEEVVDADVLLHVVDASQSRWPADVRAVDRVLAEIGADRQPRMVVFNKIDLLGTPGTPGELTGTGDEATPAGPPGYAGHRGPVVRVSALTGAGLDELAAQVGEILRQRYRRVVLAIPFARANLLARVHAAGRVVEERATDHGWTVVAELPLAEAGRLEREGWVRDGVEACPEVGEKGGIPR